MKADGYLTPGEEYFARIAKRSVTAPPRRKFPNHWVLSVAAAVALLIAFFHFRSADDPEIPVAVDAARLLETIPDQIIDDYLEVYADDFDNDEIWNSQATEGYE